MVFKRDLKGYFYRLQKETSTLPWINSAVQEEIETAIKWGAQAGCTTNPTHTPKAIKTDRKIWQPVIEKILRDDSTISDDEVVDLILQRMVKRTSELFLPIYEESKGKYGYVAIQSNPNTNDDLLTLIRKGICYSKIGINVVPKIPSTEVGAKAIEQLTAMGINTIATMGFSVAQAVAMAKAYECGLTYLQKSCQKPRCFVVIIPGVFDDYLNELVEKIGINITPGIIRYAGNAWCRRVYKIFEEQGYHADLLVGGTRQVYHFTDFVGGKIHITHSFNTWQQLIKENPPVVSKISQETPSDIISELEDKFVDFRRAYKVDGLLPHEFRSFGPCVKFNTSCVNGYSETKEEVQAARNKMHYNIKCSRE